MTLSSHTGGVRAGDKATITDKGDPVQKGKFVTLEAQLELIPSLANGIVRKHWGKAEREQYPFWIGILLIAVLGIGGMALRDVGRIALPIAIAMLAGLAILVWLYLRSVQGRFGRQWSAMASDGQLFRFLCDAGLVLGHPVEMGKPDELFTTHMDVPYSEALRAIEECLKKSALPESAPSDAPPGFHVPAITLQQPSGSESHRVYEAEYRGATVIRALSIRVSSADMGSDVTAGFTPRPSSAETRDRLVNALIGRLQDRLIAARVLSEVRECAGVEPVPIPALESQQPIADAAASRAV